METIEKKFYEEISSYTDEYDIDTLFSFSEWLQKNDDPRSRLISLEFALNFGRDIEALATELKEYKNYKCPIDLSSVKSVQSAYQELKVLHEENKRRILDIPKELSKKVSLKWEYGFIHQISLDSQQTLDSLSNFINPKHLRSITSLFLFNVTSLDLPDWVNQLPYLNYFVLSCRDIKKITKPFSNIEKLTDLDIRNNQLTEIPEWVCELHQIDELDLTQNKLKYLPDDLQKLVHLTSLNLSFNKFTAIPKIVERLTRLTYLDLSGNQLTELPIWINKLTILETLRLANNHVTAIPDTIVGLRKLEVLDLDSNRLTAIPDSICNLGQLTHLHLSYNKLTTLPESIEQLKNIESLTCYGRTLKNIPESLKSLKSIHFVKEGMPSRWERLMLTLIVLTFVILFILHYVI